MKTVVALLAVLLLFWGGGFAVSAETVEDLYREQLEASGGEELLTALPEETRQLLRRLGIDTLEATSFSELDTETVLEQLASLLATALKQPLASAGMVLGVVLLYAWADGLRGALRGEESSAVFGTVCALAVCGCVMLPLAETVGQAGEAMTSAGVFMGSFVPVYAGVLLTSGRAAAALSFQSLVPYAAQLLTWVSGQVIVPLMTVSLALGLTGSVTPSIRLGRVGHLLGKTAVWLLTLGTLLFTGLLSLQSLAGGAADSLSGRAIKFSIASFVPVVGGSLSEAFTTIRGCLQLLRSTLGCFGVAATALIVLPPLLHCVGWSLLLSVSHMAAEMFELSALTGLLETARSTVKCLIGVLTASGSFLIVAVTVVTTAASPL